MGRIVIEEATVDDLVAMADGLLQAARFRLAKGAYQAALRQATSETDKQRLRVRLGLVQTPNERTQGYLEMLRSLEAKKYRNPFISDGLATWLKTLPFDDDERFLDLTTKHAALLPLANWQWNLTTVLWAVQAVRDVPGDLIELGVFKGHTTLFCSEYVDFASWPKTWWLYDTFEGIPADQMSPGWDEIDARAYRGTFSYEEVAERFAPTPNIKVIKGRVPDILHETSPAQVAFMHMDMNNAPAEIGALEVLMDRLSPGGIVVFDDYCWAVARVQFEAERKWFAERGLHVLALPTGQGVFLKPSAPV